MMIVGYISRDMSLENVISFQLNYLQLAVNSGRKKSSKISTYNVTS